MLAPIMILFATPAPAAPLASLPMECPAWGTKPVGCVEPPLKEWIDVYIDWDEALQREQAAAGIVRRPVMTSRYDTAVPDGFFPAALRRGEAATSAHTKLLVTVAPDDSVADCRVTKIETNDPKLPGPDRSFALDPAVGEASCRLVRSHRTFRHAIDREGRSIAAALPVVVTYRRTRQELFAVPPAPSPPNRWLGSAPYARESGWPPNYTLTERVSFDVPRFKDFVADRKGLPREALVGAVLDFAPDGRVLTCAVKLPSTDQRLNEATCAALLTVRNAPTRWQVRGLPFEVRWRGDKAVLQLPGQSVLPGLVAPVALPSAALTAGAVPSQPISLRVMLDALGKPLSCTVSSTSLNDGADAASCRIVLAEGRFIGGKDAFGHPAAGGMDLRADWSKGTIAHPAGLYGY